MRTKKEIEAEIIRICDDANNFTTDNYGSEAADNGEYETYYSEFSAIQTLRQFAEWLMGNL